MFFCLAFVKCFGSVGFQVSPGPPPGLLICRTLEMWCRGISGLQGKERKLCHQFPMLVSQQIHLTWTSYGSCALLGELQLFNGQVLTGAPTRCSLFLPCPRIPGFQKANPYQYKLYIFAVSAYIVQCLFICLNRNMRYLSHDHGIYLEHLWFLWQCFTMTTRPIFGFLGSSYSFSTLFVF